MCADSLASHADAGWTRSPAVASTVVTGCWASQSICRSGCAAAQLGGDGDVAPGVPEADRRGEVERPLRPAQAPASSVGAGRRRAAPARRRTRLINRLTSTGSRADAGRGRRRPRSRASRRSTSASACALRVRADPVLVAVDHQYRAPHARGRPARQALAAARVEQAVGGCRPASPASMSGAQPTRPRSAWWSAAR